MLIQGDKCVPTKVIVAESFSQVDFDGLSIGDSIILPNDSPEICVFARKTDDFIYQFNTVTAYGETYSAHSNYVKLRHETYNQGVIKFPNGLVCPVGKVSSGELTSHEFVPSIDSLEGLPPDMMARFENDAKPLTRVIVNIVTKQSEIFESEDGLSKYIIIPQIVGQSYLILEITSEIDVATRKWEVSKLAYVASRHIVQKFNLYADEIINFLLANTGILTPRQQEYLDKLTKTLEHLSQSAHIPYARQQECVDFLGFKNIDLSPFFSPIYVNEEKNVEVFIGNLVTSWRNPTTFRLLHKGKYQKPSPEWKNEFRKAEAIHDYLYIKNQNGINPFDGGYYSNGILRSEPNIADMSFFGFRHQRDYYIKIDDMFVEARDKEDSAMIDRIKEHIELTAKLRS